MPAIAWVINDFELSYSYSYRKFLAPNGLLDMLLRFEQYVMEHSIYHCMGWDKTVNKVTVVGKLFGVHFLVGLEILLSAITPIPAVQLCLLTNRY
jgi:hypothetical protein